MYGEESTIVVKFGHGWAHSAIIDGAEEIAIIQRLHNLQAAKFPDDGNLYTPPPLQYCVMDKNGVKTLFALTVGCKMVWHGDILYQVPDDLSETIAEIIEKLIANR